jgi:hypothetical protein
MKISHPLISLLVIISLLDASLSPAQASQPAISAPAGPAAPTEPLAPTRSALVEKQQAYAAAAALACPDFNRDGLINQADLNQVSAAWTLTSADPAWNAAYDLNSDGVINIADIMTTSGR